MNIRLKIILSFFALGLIISGATIFLTTNISEKQKELGDFHLKTLIMIQTIEVTSLELIEESFAYLVSGDAEELAEFRNGHVRLSKMLGEFKEKLKLDKKEEIEEKDLYNAIILNSEEMFTIAEILFKDYEINGNVKLNNFYLYEESVDKYISSLKEMTTIEQGEVGEATKIAMETISSFTNIMFLISAMALLFAMTIGYYISTSISNPLGKLVNAADRIAKGNLDIQLDIKSGDEIGILSNSFLKMATEIKQSKDDTEEARDFANGILNSVADEIIVTDLKRQVIMMNKSAEDLLDVRLSEVVNKPIDIIIRDQTLRERIKETLLKKTIGYTFDFEWSGDNNSIKFYRARTSIIHDKQGKQNGIVTIFHDVTQEREIDRMKSEFISMAAHELRTPLTSIRGFSEILINRDKLKQSDKTKYLGYIQDQSETLSNIISDLLDISRIESGKSFILHKDSCLLGDAIKKVTKQYIDQLPKNSIRLHLPKKKIELFLDKEKMGQVLENLLSNAVKYSPDNVDIDITAKIKDEHLHVIMEDKGIGMTHDQLDKIYDKFYRADVSNTSITGTGLGLSIAKAIIEAHEGKIWIESKFGKGTKVSFSIPIFDAKGTVKIKRTEVDKKSISKDLN